MPTQLESLRSGKDLSPPPPHKHSNTPSSMVRVCNSKGINTNTYTGNDTHPFCLQILGIPSLLQSSATPSNRQPCSLQTEDSRWTTPEWGSVRGRKRETTGEQKTGNFTFLDVHCTIIRNNKSATGLASKLMHNVTLRNIFQ